ncbi:MAG: hypothetical protein ACFFDT_31390 [Candidatus Hodarchaeota archaeon]
MKKKMFFSGVLCLAMVFMVSVASHGVSIKTKLFNRDLQKCQTFIGQQYKVLTEFFDSLTAEDISSINSAKHKVEIYNTKAVSIFKKLKKMDIYYPKGVKHGHNQTAGIPRNILGGYIHSVSSYNHIVDSYEIPAEDYEEVLNKYSEYVIDVLDKLQELRGKVDSIGLTIYTLPQINEIYISQGNAIHAYLTAKHKTYDTAESFRDKVYSPWKRSFKKIPELYSNKSVLTAQKLWLEFILNNDLAINKFGDSYEEEYMIELDKIEKRLVKLSGAPEQKEKPADKIADTKPDKPSGPAQKNKFKLDLPK